MEINLKENFMIIKKRLWLIVLFVLPATILATMYSNHSYRPVYQATTKLIVNKAVIQDQAGKQQIDYGSNDVNLALIKEIIDTPTIMEKVVQRYPDLNLSAKQLLSIISFPNINETQVMTIVARHYSYEQAVNIANDVSEVFRTEVPKIMKAYNITILVNAKLEDNPSPVNKKSNQYVMLGFLGSLVIAIGIIYLLEALDDTLKTDEDIRQVLQLSTLAAIPKVKEKELRVTKREKSRKKAGEVPYATTIN